MNQKTINKVCTHQIRPLRLVRSFLAAISLMSAALTSWGAALNFSTPANWSADSDATATGGGQVFAYSWGGATTVNGVGFTATTVNNGAVGPNLNLTSFTGNNATAFTANAAPFNALSGSYSNLLRGSVFSGAGGTATVTLNNLVTGHKYFVELWVGDPRSGATTNRVVDVSSSGPVVRLYFNSTQASGGVGQYTSASFVADATTQDILLDGSAATSPWAGDPQLNAIQLRDITGVWSGTTSGDWINTDNTTLNFSGANYTTVKAATSDVYFGDKDASGSPVATSIITVGAGGVTGVNANFNNNAVAYTLNSADANGINGAYAVNLTGSGTVTFNGANTYSGNTTLSAGTLVLGNSGALSGTAALVLNGGSLDASALASVSLGSGQALSGAGTIKGSVTLASGATLVPGAIGAAGAITVTNNLTLNGQTIPFDLSFGPSGGDRITIGNALIVNSTCTLTLNYLQGALAGGTYTLMTFASMSGAGTFVLDTTYPGVTLNVNPTSLTLTVGGGGGGTSGAWTNLLGGTWGATTNWQGNTIATNVDGVADFSSLNITAARTVTINGVKTIGYMVFGDTVQDNNWTLSTGTNVLAVSSGSPKIFVNSGQNTTISASLQGSQGFSKLGTGTLTLSGANLMSGGIGVYAGALTGSAVGSFGAVNTVATVNPITLSNAVLTISAALANNAWTNNIILLGTSNNITAGAATPGFRGTTGSSLISGSGIVTINCGGNTPALAGHMDGFSGTMIINGTGSGGLLFGHNQDSGFYPSADGITGSATTAFDFEGTGVNYMYNGAMAATNYLGELRGSSSAVLWAKNGRSGAVTLEIGGLGTSSEFPGAFKDNRMGATPYTPINIRKVGGGTLTLSGSSINTGFTDVRNGELLVTGILGVTPITVQSGAVLEIDGTVSSPSISVSSGGKFLVGAGAVLGSAAIALNGLMDVSAAGGSFSLASASLSGSGVVTGAVTLAGTTLNPGPIGSGGTLTITNGDFTATGGTITFDLSNDPIGGINDQLVVNGNLNLNNPGVVFSINKVVGSLGAGNYPLIKFSGAFNGSLANLTLSGAGPLDVLQQNGNEIDLVVSPITTVTWTGGTAGNFWDILTSPNWLLSGLHTTYTNGEAVLFSDLGATNPIVTIPATVAPGGTFVSSASNYTFTGAADITDGTALTKSGTGTLTILNANTFIGTTFINGGTLKLGDGVTYNGVVAGNIADNAALVVANPADQAYAGAISGAGSLLKQGAGMLTLTADSTLTGNTTISAGTLSLGDGIAASGSLGTGRITNNSTLAINRVSAFTLSNNVSGSGGIVNLAVGPVTISGAISGTGSLTNDAGVGVGALNLASSNTYSGGTYINGGSVMLQNFSGFGAGNVIIDDSGNGSIHLAPISGATNLLANNIKLPAGTTQQFETDGTSLSTRTTIRLTGLISGGLAGSITRMVDSGISLNNRTVLVLENAGNTFTTTPEVFRGTLAFTSDGALGNSTNGISVNAANNSGAPFDATQQGLRFDANGIALNAGRSIQLVGNENIDVQGFSAGIAGPISGQGLIKLGSGTLTLNGAGTLTGATTVNAGTLLVNSDWAGTALTVNSGTTLGGSGTIEGAVSVLAGGTLSPGTSIGTLSINNTLTLAAGALATMEINAGTLACDKVVGVTTLTFGGTLNVANTGGTLTAGQSFQLFSASSYSGNFAATNLPALDPSLRWQWNPSSGALSVVGSVATNPTNITSSVSGGNLNLSWPGDHTGWRLQAQTNSAGIGTNWVTWPGSTSTNAVSIPIDVANPPVFFRLVYP